jgi:hypothetical protein
MSRVIIVVMAIPVGLTAIIGVGTRLPPTLFGLVAGGYVSAAAYGVWTMFRHEDQRLKRRLEWEKRRVRIYLHKELKRSDAESLEYRLRRVIDANGAEGGIERDNIP